MTVLSALHRLYLLRAAYRRALARASGTRVGPGVIVGSHCEIGLRCDYPRIGRISIGDHSRLEAGVLLHPYGGHIDIGPNVFLGPGVVICGHGGVTIGEASLVAMHCRILSSNHSIPAPGIPINSQPDILAPTRLGRDVWLGAGVTVLAGVTIGDGCVVGAGAVVNSDLPPGSIAVGIPARIIRSR